MQQIFTTRRIYRFGLILAVLCQTACATFVPISTRTSPSNADQEVYDPLEGFNRGVNSFNQGLDKVFIGPVARGYKTVVPRFIRKRIRNVSSNLSEPVNFGNELLQLDLDDAGVAFSRFFINSTVGLGGLFDVASKDPELQYQREDFGQTLATYNVPAGPYVVLPLLGPSNLRDFVGRAGDVIANPVRRVNFDGETATIVGINTASFLDLRAQQDGRLKTIRESADPYVNLRTLYNQNRASNIHEDSDPFDDLADFE